MVTAPESDEDGLWCPLPAAWAVSALVERGVLHQHEDVAVALRPWLPELNDHLKAVARRRKRERVEAIIGDASARGRRMSRDEAAEVLNVSPQRVGQLGHHLGRRDEPGKRVSFDAELVEQWAAEHRQPA